MNFAHLKASCISKKMSDSNRPNKLRRHSLSDSQSKPPVNLQAIWEKETIQENDIQEQKLYAFLKECLVFNTENIDEPAYFKSIVEFFKGLAQEISDFEIKLLCVLNTACK